MSPPGLCFATRQLATAPSTSSWDRRPVGVITFVWSPRTAGQSQRDACRACAAPVLVSGCWCFPRPCFSRASAALHRSHRLWDADLGVGAAVGHLHPFGLRSPGVASSSATQGPLPFRVPRRLERTQKGAPAASWRIPALEELEAFGFVRGAFFFTSVGARAQRQTLRPLGKRQRVGKIAGFFSCRLAGLWRARRVQATLAKSQTPEAFYSPGRRGRETLRRDHRQLTTHRGR